MNIQHIVPAHVAFHLTDGLQEGQALNIAYRAADFYDGNLSFAFVRHLHDPTLDFIGNMRNHLHRAAVVITATFLRQDGPVDLTGRNVVDM